MARIMLVLFSALRRVGKTGVGYNDDASVHALFTISKSVRYICGTQQILVRIYGLNAQKKVATRPETCSNIIHFMI